LPNIVAGKTDPENPGKGLWLGRGGTYGPKSYNPAQHRITIKTDERYKPNGDQDFTLDTDKLFKIASTVVHETRHAIDIKNGSPTDTKSLEYRAFKEQYNFIINHTNAPMDLKTLQRNRFGQNGFEDPKFEKFYNDVYINNRSWPTVPGSATFEGSWWTDSRIIFNCN